MALINKIPYLYFPKIEDIDFKELAKIQIKALLFDLDNTIIPYNEPEIPREKVAFLKQLEEDFKVVILTNNSIKRASVACGGNFNCVAQARKPFRKGLFEALEIAGCLPSEAVIIGDQLQSDINCGNKYFVKQILVNPIDLKSDTIPTRINRFFEKNAILKIQEKYPLLYEKKLKAFHSYLERD